MSLNKLKLENFKRFKSLDLDISKNITVILGENSSGKSSILKSILGLKQTISPSNEHECWAAQGEYVDLGTYQDIVNQRDIQNPFSIETTIEVDNHKQSIFLRKIYGAKNITLKLKYDHDNTTNQARLLQIKSIIESENETNEKGEISWTLTRQKTRKNYNLTISDALINSLNSTNLFLSKYYVEPSEKITLQNPEKLHFKTVSEGSDPKSNIITNMINQTIGTLTNYVEKNVFYLAPLRSSPSRSYIRSSHSLAVGVKGEYTPSVLANLEKRSSKATRGESTNRTNSASFERWLNIIFPGHSANTKTIEELVKLKISNKQTQTYSATEKSDTITDVGFGFSQVFPIIVQAAVMPADSTLIIEQPELHLHPLAQTRLAQVITEAASQGKKFIIETHSEHFIRGLQLAISENRIDPKKGIPKEKIKIHYIKAQPHNHETLEINDFGEFITEWPTGFFDESYRTMQKLLINKMKETN